MIQVDVYENLGLVHSTDHGNFDRIDTFPIDRFHHCEVQFSPDGSMLAHLGDYSTIWDVSTMSWKSVRGKGNRISHILLSVDGTKILYARQRSEKPTELCVLDVLHDFSPTIKSDLRVQNPSISPDGNHVLAQGADNSNACRMYLHNIDEKTS